MLEQLKIKLRAKKIFFRNFLSLAVFQLIELIIPLVTIPIIINKVGIENFGLINFALVFSIFFQLIINFGFNTISVREIAINKDDFIKIKEIHYNTINAKIILSFFCFFLATIIIFSFSIFNSTPQIFFFTMLSLFGQSLIPVWFFQGLQKSKYLTISSLIGKIFYLVAILFLLDEPKDYIMVPIYNFISYFITFSLASYIIYYKYGIIHQFTSFNSFREHLKMGKYMFLSELKLFFLSSFNVFILGIVSGNVAVAYFVGAEKYLRAISNLFTPIQSSLFPVLSLKLVSNMKSAKHLIIKIAVFFAIVLFILCFSLFLLSNWIINLFLGPEMNNSVIVFKILAFIPLLSFFDSFFGKQILLNLKKEKIFFKVILIVALVNIPLNYLLSLKYSYIGASISQLISQLILLGGMAYYAYFALKIKKNV